MSALVAPLISVLVLCSAYDCQASGSNNTNVEINSSFPTTTSSSHRTSVPLNTTVFPSSSSPHLSTLRPVFKCPNGCVCTSCETFNVKGHSMFCQQEATRLILNSSQDSLDLCAL